jgi:hypothetical protein
MIFMIYDISLWKVKTKEVPKTEESGRRLDARWLGILAIGWC